jgi:hypothetical protein
MSIWCWPPSTSGAKAAATTLTQSKDFYVDPINGSDTNDGSQTAPWQTVGRFHTFLNQFLKIGDDVNVTLHYVTQPDPEGPQSITTFTSIVYPELGRDAHIVHIGDGFFNGFFDSNTFVAQGASTTRAIVSNEFPFPDDRIGWTIECIDGANLGLRRQVVNTINVDGDITVTPTAALPVAGIGDTWILRKPANTVQWPIADIITLESRGEGLEMLPGMPGGDSAGIYFVNLRFTGQPVFGSRATIYLFGVEYDGTQGLAPGLFQRSGNVLSGLAYPTLGAEIPPSMPWLNVPIAANWAGWGLTQRREECDPTALGILLAQGVPIYLGGNLFGGENTDGTGTFYGFAIGYGLVNDARFNQCDVIGGRLFGSQDTNPLFCFGEASLGLYDAGLDPNPLYLDTATFEDCVFVFGGRCVIGANVIFSSTGSSYITVAYQGLAIVFAFFTRPELGTPAAANVALRCVNFGRIAWYNAVPTLTGVVSDIQCDADTFTIAALVAAGIVKDVRTGLNWVALDSV